MILGRYLSEVLGSFLIWYVMRFDGRVLKEGFFVILYCREY